MAHHQNTTTSTSTSSSTQKHPWHTAIGGTAAHNACHRHTHHSRHASLPPRAFVPERERAHLLPTHTHHLAEKERGAEGAMHKTRTPLHKTAPRHHAQKHAAQPLTHTHTDSRGTQWPRGRAQHTRPPVPSSVLGQCCAPFAFPFLSLPPLRALVLRGRTHTGAALAAQTRSPHHHHHRRCSCASSSSFVALPALFSPQQHATPSKCARLQHLCVLCAV